MRSDIQELLKRQAEWQRSRAAQPWAAKIRASLRMRSSVLSISNRRAKKALAPES